jgi:hypothetical protein
MASMRASYHILRTPAAPAPAAIARIATDPISGSTWTGATMNPTSAVKMASAITRGFISVMKSGKRTVKPYRAGNSRCETEIAVVFIVNSLRSMGRPRAPQGLHRLAQSREKPRCLHCTREGQFDDFSRRGRLRTGLDGYPNSVSALHLGLA